MFSDRIEGKVVAVGDIHGDLDQARRLLDYLTQNGVLENRWIVFLGDYVDVGPDTAKVIELLLDVRATHPQTTFLCGNHDLNLAKATGLVDSPHKDFYWHRLHTRNARTLQSYYAKGNDLIEKMPAEHKDFLASLPWVVEHPDYLFVHCGFDPRQPIDEQVRHLRERDAAIFKPKWLHDDRLSFVDHRHQTAKTIIAGHAILSDVRRCGNKVLMDTGAGYGGVLSALLLPEIQIIQTAI